MAAITLTEENFATEVLSSSVPVFVDFWVPWCGPCQMMGPMVEQLATELDPGTIKIGKVNVDDNQVLAGKYNILSIPTFGMFKNGELVDQAIGGMQKEKLLEFINKHINA